MTTLAAVGLYLWVGLMSTYIIHDTDLFSDTPVVVLVLLWPLCFFEVLAGVTADALELLFRGRR